MSDSQKSTRKSAFFQGKFAHYKNMQNTAKTTSPEQALWWQHPDGFVFKAEPNAYTLMRTFPGTDAEELLKKAGYESTQLGLGYVFQSETDPLSLVAYDHRAEKHSMVSIWNGYGELSCFFVDRQHRDAFFAIWYVQFLRDAALANYLRELPQITNTLIAFVRYGHGERVIDEYDEPLK
jgi:hypothetical protein